MMSDALYRDALKKGQKESRHHKQGVKRDLVGGGVKEDI